MKPYEYYTDAGDYPQKPVAPIMPKNTTSAIVRAFADTMEKYETEIEVYKAKRKAYDEKKSALHQEFKVDIFEEFGVTNHPKAEKVFELAWDYGHANGYREVSYYFEQLVELIL